MASSRQIKAEPLEVKSLPEELRYIPEESTWQKYFIKPIARRGAWLITGSLAALSIGPLIFKGVLNLIDACFDRNSLAEAKKNIVSAVIAMPILTVVSVTSAVFPVIGRTIVKFLVIPAGSFFGYLTRMPDDKRSLKAEVGPRTAPTETTALIRVSAPWEDLRLESLKLPSNRFYPDVLGKDGIEIDSADLVLEVQEEKKGTPYRIVFNPTGDPYQLSLPYEADLSKMLSCHTRTFNYPGVTKENNVQSITDLINAGIAQVYDLAKKQNWSNAEIEKNVHFYGYCFGGGIALQTAAYFKQKHNLNIFTYADRSFSSLDAVSAGVLKSVSGLPLWYANALTSAALYAGGGFNMDSIAALKKLDPQKVVFTNLGPPNYLSHAETLPRRMKYHLGIGAPLESKDKMLRDGSSLLESVLEQKPSIGIGYHLIHDKLKLPNGHFIHAHEPSEKAHALPLSMLYANQDVFAVEISELNLYREMARRNASASSQHLALKSDSEPGVRYVMK